MAKSKHAGPNSRDPVTTYARQVLAGRWRAGPDVRNACARHLRDLEEAPKRGFFFDRKKVARVLGYFRDELHLNGGEYEGRPFDPLPWQCFILGSVFGWVDAEGLRRFRLVYVETGKGSGKSPLAAGVGLYGLTADSEPRAEVYAAATKKDQAMILFRDAVAMVDQSPNIGSVIQKSGSPGHEWNLAYLSAAGFFRPISADDGQSGPRPHIGLLDEIHEHKKGTVVEMMLAGRKNRRQPIIFMITNAGFDKTSVCWSYHEYAQQVCAGQRQDDSFFGYVCGLDEGDDPFKDESCWHKTNPSLYVGLPSMKSLREQVLRARGMPAAESVVRRLHFCEWVGAEDPWIPSDLWFEAADPDFDVQRLRGRRCYAGLDLSSTQDLTAAALHFEPVPDDPVWRELVFFWLPNDNLHEKADQDRVPYVEWRNAGYLETTAGRAINKRAVVRKFAESMARYDLQTVCYDRWRIEELKMLLEDEGITLPLKEFGQGFQSMAPAVDEYERRLCQGEFKHQGNPVQTWCAANAVLMTDPASNRKLAKDRATGRIDGMVAAVMACGASLMPREAPVQVGMEVLE